VEVARIANSSLNKLKYSDDIRDSIESNASIDQPSQPSTKPLIVSSPSVLPPTANLQSLLLMGSALEGDPSSSSLRPSSHRNSRLFLLDQDFKNDYIDQLTNSNHYNVENKNRNNEDDYKANNRIKFGDRDISSPRSLFAKSEEDLFGGRGISSSSREFSKFADFRIEDLNQPQLTASIHNNAVEKEGPSSSLHPPIEEHVFDEIKSEVINNDKPILSAPSYSIAVDIENREKALELLNQLQLNFENEEHINKIEIDDGMNNDRIHENEGENEAGLMPTHTLSRQSVSKSLQGILDFPETNERRQEMTDEQLEKPAQQGEKILQYLKKQEDTTQINFDIVIMGEKSSAIRLDLITDKNKLYPEVPIISPISSVLPIEMKGDKKKFRRELSSPLLESFTLRLDSILSQLSYHEKCYRDEYGENI
jgi:hypothetical protein